MKQLYKLYQHPVESQDYEYPIAIVSEDSVLSSAIEELKLREEGSLLSLGVSAYLVGKNIELSFTDYRGDIIKEVFSIEPVDMRYIT